jgi:hypothetical protein
VTHHRGDPAQVVAVQEAEPADRPLTALVIGVEQVDAESGIGNLADLYDGQVRRSYSYNPSGPDSVRPHAVTDVTALNPNGTPAGHDSYGDDPNGAMNARQVGGGSASLSWTETHQLASVSGPAGATDFRYDADGDRLVMTSQPTISAVRSGDWRQVGRSGAATIGDVAASGALFVSGLGEGALGDMGATAGREGLERGAVGGPGKEIVKSEWPPNRFFMNNSVQTTLQPGILIDRYRHDSGTFVSPQGTPFPERSLPANDVQASIAAPWFGQSGGGIQYELPSSVADL